MSVEEMACTYYERLITWFEDEHGYEAYSTIIRELGPVVAQLDSLDSAWETNYASAMQDTYDRLMFEMGVNPWRTPPPGY